MKKLLLVFTLGLFAAINARSQVRATEFRKSDPFVGHIKNVRMEMASFSKVNGAVIEGPRRVVKFSSYSPDGTRREVEDYAPDGSVQRKFVFLYDDSGKQLEQSQYDGQSNLISRNVFRPDVGEMLLYSGDGTLLNRTQVVWNEKHEAVETRTYGGGGALLMRKVKTRESEKSVWKTYAPNGALVLDATVFRDDDGLLRKEQKYYKDDGSFVSHISITETRLGKNFETIYKDRDGKPRTKYRETRELDSRKNPLKVTYYIWGNAANDFVPLSVSYYTITYYD